MAKGSYPTSLCQDPFTNFLKLNKDAQEVANDLLNIRLDENLPIILDIGGEGRFQGAINLNPQFLTSTTGQEGRLIPSWLPGNGNYIPLPAQSVDIIHLQNAPINQQTMREMLRVLKPRSQIHLTHPKDYAQTYFDQLKEVFGSASIIRKDKGIMSDFYIQLEH